MQTRNDTRVACYDAELDAVYGHLLKAQRIIITAHEKPDGDAVGSCIGLGWLLKNLHGNNSPKQIIIYNESGFPDWLSFLELPCDVVTKLDFPFEPDLIVMLDCGDPQRLGQAMCDYIQKKPTINIDHHLGNPLYGTLVNWVNPQKAATGEMITDIALAHEIEFNKYMMESLYVAITADTGNFSFDNTNVNVLRQLIHFVEHGLQIPKIRAKLDNSWSLAKMHFWGDLMQNIQLAHDAKLAYIKITDAMFTTHNAHRDDLEGFVEQIRKLKGVRVAVLMREEIKNGEMYSKMSIRSSGNDDVRQIALAFGGGGHKNASGAKAKCTMDEMMTKVLELANAVWDN